jgi:riboflavin synthase
MFTGIVTARGRIERVEPRADGGLRLVLAWAGERPAVAVGDSVAVDGTCLTVVGVDGVSLAFDAVPETLRKTTLPDRRPGDLVNLEAALRAGDRLGGHLVQGHVEGTARVDAVERRGDDVRMTLRVDGALVGALLPKGSVTLDGVSLTVGEVDGARFSVYLVPHTLAVTGLSDRRPGDRVNVEPDLVGRWVEHHVRRLLEDGSVPQVPSENRRSGRRTP